MWLEIDKTKKGFKKLTHNWSEKDPKQQSEVSQVLGIDDIHIQSIIKTEITTARSVQNKRLLFIIWPKLNDYKVQRPIYEYSDYYEYLLMQATDGDVINVRQFVRKNKPSI